MPAGPIVGLPNAAAVYNGNDTGHGTCVPANTWPTNPCGTLCPAVVPKEPIAKMDGTNMWPPFPQLPLVKIEKPSVLINNFVPILDQDVLTNHPPTCTQIVPLVTGNCAVTITCPTQTLCVEDIAGGGAHVRKATATSATVFINGKRACKVGDPLGPPCLSLISTGSVNVFIGP